jgi:hypothetical protein
LSRYLNIVAFDVPFPANYGGVIDVYYKLVALKKQDVKIILHCFTYGRKPAPELEALCEKVFYYNRRTGWAANLSLLPYTVKSRQNKELKKNLLENSWPVLFEVLHTCFLLTDKDLAGRQKFYRHSNIEHDYYRELSLTEKNPVKRLYLKIESWKLKRFETLLLEAQGIFAVNEKDTQYFKHKYPNAKSVYIPSFHPVDNVEAREGNGVFVLFHGNLAISENYEACTWLIRNVFSRMSERVVVAGLNPPEFLKKLIEEYPNIELIAGPTDQKMFELIKNAHVHVLYTAQPTGLKLKLLNVLFSGRFIVCNTHMISGTGLSRDRTFLIANSNLDFLSCIRQAFESSFSISDLEARKKMTQRFSNDLNVKKLIEAIYS